MMIAFHILTDFLKLSVLKIGRQAFYADSLNLYIYFINVSEKMLRNFKDVD